LQHGPDAKVAKVFKLALHELIGRGVIKPDFSQQGSGRTTTRTALLLPGIQRPREISRPLQSIMDTYDDITAHTPHPNGVTLQELAGALRQKHAGSLDQWVTDEVVGTLVERGFYTEEHVKRLGLFNTTNYEPTPEGKAARAELESSIKRAEDQFSSWASDEPARAAAFLALAGPAVLLMPGLQKPIARFRGASHGARKMMAAGSETVVDLADQDFDIYRLEDAHDNLKILDDAIDYGRLERDREGGEHPHQP
jgi:hypothetical protein